jgi:hypothetical protein
MDLPSARLIVTMTHGQKIVLLRSLEPGGKIRESGGLKNESFSHGLLTEHAIYHLVTLQV